MQTNMSRCWWNMLRTTVGTNENKQKKSWFCSFGHFQWEKHFFRTERTNWYFCVSPLHMKIYIHPNTHSTGPFIFRPANILLHSKILISAIYVLYDTYIQNFMFNVDIIFALLFSYEVIWYSNRKFFFYF